MKSNLASWKTVRVLKIVVSLLCPQISKWLKKMTDEKLLQINIKFQHGLNGKSGSKSTEFEWVISSNVYANKRAIYSTVTQGAEEGYLTVFPVKFTVQLQRESICCWFKSLCAIGLCSFDRVTRLLVTISDKLTISAVCAFHLTHWISTYAWHLAC